MSSVVRAQSHLLEAVDAICTDLRATCGLTRFTLVVQRASSPLAITFEDAGHRRRARSSGASLRIELCAGTRALGHVTIEDAGADSFSSEAEAIARNVLQRHLGELVFAFPATAGALAATSGDATRGDG